MPYALKNKKNGQFVKVVGDGSESLVAEVVQATIFPDLVQANEGLAEHDKWVGPLEMVKLNIKVTYNKPRTRRKK